MAIAYVGTGTSEETFTSDLAPQDVTIDLGSGSGRVLWLICAMHDNTVGELADNAVTLSGGIGDMIPAGAQTATENEVMGRLFYKAIPGGNTGNHTATITYGQDFPGDVEGLIGWIVLSGVDATTPADGYASGSGTDNNAELTITSPTGDMAVVFVIGRAFSPTDVTANGSTFTRRFVDIFGSTELYAAGGTEPGDGSVATITDVASALQIRWKALGANSNVAAAAGPPSLASYSPMLGITQRAVPVPVPY